MSLKMQSFQFGDFFLDTGERVLLRDKKPVAITPKTLLLLQTLVENHGHIVEKDQLMKMVWPDSFVEEGNLSFTINLLRKALSDDKQNPRFIETVPKRGYRFIAEVRRVEAKHEAPEFVEDDSITQANGQGASSISFPQLIEHAAGASSQLVALADWRHESDENESKGSEPETLKPKLELVPPRQPAANMRIIFVFTGLAFLVLLAGFFVLKNETNLFLRLGISGAADRSHGFWRIEKLTDTGNINGADISADGKLLTYITDELGKHGIWLRQLTTGKTVPVIPIAEELLLAVRFSRDGDFIYYLHQSKEESLRLSRVSILGGPSTKILSDLHGGYDLSPDETQIAFVRLNENDTTVMIADASGVDERAVFSSAKPDYILDVEWSPDGKSIAYCVGKFQGGGKNFALMNYDLESQTAKPIANSKWAYMEYFSWLPDQSGLFLTGRQETGGTDQVWRISVPDGKVEQITNDPSQLSLHGATLDGKKLIATQTNLNSTLWVAPADNLSNLQPVSKAQRDLAWTADGKLVFSGRDTMDTDIWETKPDGTGKKQLTANNSAEQRPKVSPDGKFIVYVSNQGGRQNIWRMDIDGGNLKQLTTGDGEDFPAFTIDGQSVVFNSLGDGSVWTIPLTGGTPTQLTTEKCTRFSLSPSGDKVAYLGRIDGKRKLLVKTFPEFQLLHEFDVRSSNPTPPKIVWTDNEKALVYNFIDESLIGNLMRQEIGGGAPQKLTNFTSNLIFDFDFSPDGKQLGIVSGSWDSDIVLIHEP